MIKRLIIICFFYSLLLGNGYAQQVAIVAFVNEDVVTAHDLEQQIKIFRLIGVLPDDGSDVDSVTQQQILDVLVANRIKRQLMTQARVRIDEALLEQEYSGLAIRLKIDRDTLLDYLKQQGISAKAMRHFIISNTIWEVYVRRFAFRFVPSESEISTRYQQALNQLSQTRYYIHEIILPVDSIIEDTLKRQQAENVIAQLLDGADFKSIASNISEVASANQGGLRGWVSAGELSTEERQIIQNLPVNGLTDNPVRLEQGYAIYWLQDKKDPDGSYRQTLDYQLHLFEGNSKGQVNASNYMQDVNGSACSEKPIANALDKKLFEKIEAQEITTDLQKYLALLVEGEKSNVFFHEGQWAVLGLCKRQEIGTPLVKRVQVRDKIILDRLNDFSLQHLEEEIRKSYIEKKLS